MTQTFKHPFKLGSRLRCRVTGYTGIAVTVEQHLNGCVQYGIKPEVGKDGKMPEGWAIDSQQLELLDDGLNETKPVERKVTGGPMRKL